MQKVMYSDYSEFEDVHWWFRGRNAILNYFLKTILGNNNNLHILDIGCSTGVMLPQLSQYGFVDALEPSEFAIKICKSKNLARVNLIHGTFPEAIPPDKKYNLITLFDTLEHLDDDLSVLKKAHELLNPGGKIICTVPAYQCLWSHHDEVNQHLRRYTISSLRAKMLSAGFKTLKITYFNTLLFLPAIVVRFFRELTPFLNKTETDIRLFKNRTLNNFLSGIFGFEKNLIRHVSLPFGLSILYVGEK